ncbi:hypothetical protein GGR50DRAFT_197735 [Xylaria sp. CBS 124048]|nr:hypothetical protein GGR50DRAFT_197735 [Xylaria sp. CBS 124048]
MILLTVQWSPLDGTRAEVAGPTAEVAGPKAEVAGPKAEEVAGPKAEVTGPTAEVTGPIAEVTGPKADVAVPTRLVTEGTALARVVIGPPASGGFKGRPVLGIGMGIIVGTKDVPTTVKTVWNNEESKPPATVGEELWAVVVSELEEEEEEEEDVVLSLVDELSELSVVEVVAVTPAPDPSPDPAPDPVPPAATVIILVTPAIVTTPVGIDVGRAGRGCPGISVRCHWPYNSTHHRMSLYIMFINQRINKNMG